MSGRFALFIGAEALARAERDREPRQGPSWPRRAWAWLIRRSER